MASYIYPHDVPGERERLELLAEILDESSKRNISRSGIARGWRCLEVAAGVGTLSTWMADEVGPDGIVVATDLHTDFIEPIARDNLRVAQFDVVNDEPPLDALDLVVGRAILHHLPARREVLCRSADWVKPGGWVYFEEPDVRVADLIEPASQRELWRGWIAWGAARGIDFTMGGSLADWMAEAGLEPTFVETTMRTYNGGGRHAQLFHTSLMAVAGELVEHGVDAALIDEFDRLYKDPGFWTAPIAFTSALGRRPA
ncbi:MAG: class I SAM-dependent methyltransferase [Actinomycetota bacterium]